MTRRHAQIILLLCGVAWVLFNFLVAPHIIRSAYHGESYEILNRMISGRSVYPVEFYIRKWAIASWILLMIVMALVMPVISFTPRQLSDAWIRYWFKPTSVVIWLCLESSQWELNW